MGSFGYCSNCQYVPLIPLGGNPKPNDESAVGFCYKCKERFDLFNLDSCMFNTKEIFIEELKQSIDFLIGTKI